MRVGSSMHSWSRRTLAAVALGMAGFALPVLAGGTALANVDASVNGGISQAAAGSTAGGTTMQSVVVAPRIPVGASAIGAVAPSATETGAVALKPSNQAGLVKFINEVTSKHSAMYGHYLAPGAFRTVFGPSAATIDAVEATLEESGLRVTGVSRDGLLVSFSGTASTVERAFDTGITAYHLADGRTGQATTSAVKLPSSIAKAVTTVIGLNNLVSAKPLGVLRQPVSNMGHEQQVKAAAISSYPPGAPDACPAAQGAAQEFGGLTDSQIANSYGAFGLYANKDFGAGQTVAIYELEPFLPSDISTFDSCYFGATAATQMASRLTVIPVDGGQPTGPGSGEAVLDVEDVSAIASGANINVYEAPNTSFGGLDEYSAIVNNDTAKVVTSSWGLCEQAVQLGEPGMQQAENFLFEQAAAQGQSIFAAAGDTGTDDCNAFRYPEPISGQNPLSVDDPGSQPYVISVGGTTITDATTPPAEKVWNDGAQWGAGGGGLSMSWTMPSWQQSSMVPGIPKPGTGTGDYTQANAVETEFGYPTGFCDAVASGGNPGGADPGGSAPCRTVPDVSAQADEFTGAVTIYSSMFIPDGVPDGWITIGGTSSATPIWASSLALVNASGLGPACDTGASGVGFVSPLLYGVASTPTEYAASFTNVTTGNNDIYGLDNGQVFPATTGYSLAAGLGSPQLTNPSGTPGLAYNLCQYSSAGGAPGVTGLNPSTLSTAGGSVVITGTGFESSGVADVGTIQVGAAQITSTHFTVNSSTQITATFPPAVQTLAANSPAPQDGAGPADVFVTLNDGVTSLPGAGTTMEYVDESVSSTPVPSVTGVSPYGGLETGPQPVTIFGSGFASTGADAVTSVTFGGVAATGYTVKTPFEITVTPPVYSSSATSCAASVSGESPTTDICQVEVVVTNANGSSATAAILPPYEGAALPATTMGVGVAPSGTEEMPAPTEYDYIPAPTITSVSTSVNNPDGLGPYNYASELGGTLVTITGTGFNPLTLSWVNVGPANLASSQDFNLAYYSGTTLVFEAPAIIASAGDATVQPDNLPVSVATLAGVSAASQLTYAGIPTVTGVTNNSNSTTVGGMSGAVDTGGTPITISGAGFEQAVGPLVFSDYDSPFSIGTQYTYTINSDTSVSAQTVAQNSAIVDVELCTVTGCSLNPPSDFFVLYPPGNPTVDSISPTSGSPAGGTSVTISGENLGCVTGVFFGTTAAATFSNEQAILDCGSTYQAVAVSPPGGAGTSVPVTVTTLESDFTGGAVSSNANFTYLASAYTALAPTRLLDTRVTHQTLGPNSSLSLTVVGGQVPSTATAVAINVTVTNTTAASYLTVYPGDTPQPTVSNLNWSAGQTVANLVIVPVGSNGQVNFYNASGSTDVVVDLEGYFAPEASSSTAGSYVPLTPARITDTRTGSGYPNSGKTLGPGGTLNIKVEGVGGVPAADVSAAILNITVTNTTAASYLTAYPQGTTRPTASNVNWTAGETVANRVVVPVNPATGEITVYNDGGMVDVVVDVDGYFSNGTATPSSATLYTPITPVRVVDTRSTGQTLGAGSTLVVALAGVDGIATNATAVVTNVTATDTTASSYFTVYPGGTRPITSDVNWTAGETVPNLTVAALSNSGSTSIFNHAGNADAIVDAFGYFSPI